MSLRGDGRLDLHVPQPADSLSQAALLSSCWAPGSICDCGGLELKAALVTAEWKWKFGTQEKKYPPLFLESSQKNSC